jgi:UDP-N-acetylglucosamine--N-acetylmuramyl-(pentapeptide) pyrophosphoryl-undecaprenol N-acetylglucosamine transferase
VVVGFGGYVATPAYLAARRAAVPIVVHEQNARPGLANRLGARLGASVATTFAQTSLPHAEVVGMPLRREISTLDREALRGQATEFFGLSPERPTVLVTGGSLGAQRLNTAFAGAAPDLAQAGIQVLHLTGAGKEVQASDDPALARYVTQPYTDRMDLAYAAADLAVCRAGAGTVCELSAVGLPAVYVPLPVGNGEQRLNASGVVAAGGGMLVRDAEVSAAWVRQVVLPLMQDTSALQRMSAAAEGVGQRDADEAMVELVLRAVGRA